MMRHLCNFVTVLFLISFPASAFSASSEPDSSTQLSDASNCCLAAIVNIAEPSGMTSKKRSGIANLSANIDTLQEPELSPTLRAISIEPLLKLNSTHGSRVPDRHSIDPSILRRDDIFSAGVSSRTVPSNEADETESFDPNLVVSSGSNNDTAANDNSIDGRTPALALLALAVIGMAAVSRRTDGIFPSNKA